MNKVGEQIPERAPNLPDGYRMTELGPLPEEWRVVRLGEVATFETGKRAKGGALLQGSVLSLGGEHITEDGRIDFYTKPKFISFDFFKSLRKGIVQNGDVLIAKDGARSGKSAFVAQKPVQFMAVNEHVFIVRTQKDSGLLADFLGFWVRTEMYWVQVREVFHGIIGGINRKDLATFLLPLPPLPEQRAIAHVLHTVQEAKEATEQVIAALRELKRSLMRHLFTYGPVAVDQTHTVPLQETEIGTIPAHWRVVRLGEVYSIQQGKALSRKHREGKSPYPFLRTSNVLWGRLDLQSLDEMDFTPRERSKLQLEPGDLLICEGGEIGRTAIWNGEMENVYYQNHIFRVRAQTDKVWPWFHMYWMQAAITLFGVYQGRGNKTTIPNLSKRRLAAFPIPLPPLPEQRQIAHILQTIDRKIEAEEARQQALDDLFRSLLHHLMTARIRLPADFIARFDEPVGTTSGDGL